MHFLQVLLFLRIEKKSEKHVQERLTLNGRMRMGSWGGGGGIEKVGIRTLRDGYMGLKSKKFLNQAALDTLLYRIKSRASILG